MKKFSTVILTAVLACSMMTNVSAYSFEQKNTKFGTEGKLSVSGDGSAYTPFLGKCIMQSAGNSKFTFKKNNKGYTCKMTKHAADIRVGGLGGLSISNDGISLEIFGDDDVYTVKSGGAKDWDFHFVVSRGRMLSYMQTHVVDYKLQKKSKADSKVSLSGYWKWGF